MGTKNNDVVFDLDAAAFSSDDFRIYQFKVKRCPRARPHDWTQCPFAHPGEKAKRRCPKRYRYSGTACPEFRRNGCCRRQDACPFAHGVFECWLHPSRYRTQMCTDGVGCKRRVCFFAHAESELRKPEEDPVWLQQQMQAEMAAEQQATQQSHALKVFSALLNQGGQSSPAATTGGSGAATGGAVEVLRALLGGNAAPSTAGNAAPVQPAAQSATSAQEEALQQVLQLLQGQQPTAPAPAASTAPAPASSPAAAALLQLLGLDKAVAATPATQQPAAVSAAATAPVTTAITTQPLQQLLAALTGGTAVSDAGASSGDLQVKLLHQLVQQQIAAGTTSAAPVAAVPVPAATQPDLTKATDLLQALGLLQPSQASAAAAAPSLVQQLQQLTLAAAALEGQQKVDVPSAVAAATGAVPSTAPVPAAAPTPAAHPAGAVAQALLAATTAVPPAATDASALAAVLAPAAATLPPAAAVPSAVVGVDVAAVPLAPPSSAEVQSADDTAATLASLIAGLTGTAAAAPVSTPPSAGTVSVETAANQQALLQALTKALGQTQAGLAAAAPNELLPSSTAALAAACDTGANA